MPLTHDQIMSELDYYGLKGEDAEACAQAYLERQADGNPPDLGEFAEAWAAL